MDWEPQLAPPVEIEPIEASRYRLPWGTVLVTSLLVLVFVAQQQIGPTTCAETVLRGTCDARHLTDENPLVGVLTFPLLHGNGSHLASNLVWILLLGTAFEQRRSSVTLLGLLLLSAYFSIFADIALGVAAGEPRIAIGMSGANRALGGFLLVQFIPSATTLTEKFGGRPKMSEPPTIDPLVLIAGFVGCALILTSALEVTGIIDVAPNVAIYAHVAGAVVGIACGLFARIL